MEQTLKRTSVVVIICSVVLVAFIVVQYTTFPKILPTLPFDGVDQGGYSGIGIRVNYIIDDLETWETLWTDIHNISTNTPELPFVNFTTEVIIAVFLGEFATGGYVAQITRIENSTSGLTVHIKEEHPGPSCIVTMAITRPYHIIKAELSSSQPIEFEYNVIVRNCPW